VGAAWAWAKSELRRRRGASLALILLIGIGGAVVLTTAAGARRADTAFDRFITSSDTADVQVQYSSEDDVDDAVLDAFRHHPDVEVATPVYFTIGFSEDTGYDLLVLSSPDAAQFRDIDRARLLEGRRPDPQNAHEVIVTPFIADILGVDVGDTVTIGTFSAEQFEAEDFGEPEGPTFDLEVVGRGTLPYDAADESFGALIATPAFYERYAGDAGGFGPSLEVLVRDGADAEKVAEEVTSDFTFDELFFTPSSDLSESIEDGTHAVVVGLWIFTAVAALAFFVATGQAIRRRLETSDLDLPILRAVGMPRLDRGSAVGMTVAPIITVGCALAALLAVPASATMPIGAARRAEPHPGILLDPVTLVLGAIVLGLILLLSAAWAATRVSAQRSDLGMRSSARAARLSLAQLVRAQLRPPSHLGVTMALDPGSREGTVPVRSALVGAVMGAAGLAAVVTFAASLDALVSDPVASGWNWTFQLEVEGDADIRALDAVPGVEDVGTITTRQVVVAGEPVAGSAVTAVKGDPSLTVLDGRMPVNDGEVAVGPVLAERAGLHLGDPVVMSDPGGAEVSKVVVGEALFPTFDDDSTFNDGVALTPDALDALAQSDGSEALVVRFADSVSQDEAAARVAEVLPEALSVYSYPSLPTDVANLDDVRSLPRALAVFLALLAVAAVGHAVATTVQRRRRELGTVRSVGFLGRDVRTAVLAQATSLVLAGLIVGLPIGVVIGRIVWRAVAEGIGVDATPTVPVVLLLAVIVPGAIAAGLLVALLPGRSAARGSPLEALRVE
jgi:ABC-type lipoprotein release transport system permease subunit